MINFSNRQTNALVTLTDISPGAYQILGLVDNVDPTKRSKLGVETSCTPDGWPYGSPRAFRMIEGMSVKPYLPGEGVRPNSSTRDGFEIAWIGRWVVSLVLGLFAL